MTDFKTLLGALAGEHVEFILVGGVAATVHGSSRLTQDVDIVYRRTPANVARLVRALSAHAPYLRGAPKGLPFQLDVETVKRGLNFTLSTVVGDLDLLGELVGGGDYENLRAHCIRVQLFGVECLCLDLETLIEVKRAAGRPKDLDAIAELEAILEERKNKAP